MQTLSKNKLIRFGVFFLLNSILLGWLLFGVEPTANQAQALFPLGGSDTCTAATPIIGTFPYNDTGTTTGATDNYDLPQDETAPTCTAPVGWAQGGVTATSGDRGAIFDGTGTGPDVAYSVKTDKTCRLQASMTPTGYNDLALIVYLAQCTNSLNNCVVVSDISGEGGGETVKWEAAAGQTYYIVVDGYTPPDTFPYSSGPYTLQVSEITSTGCEAYGNGPEITVSQGGNDIRDEVGAVNFGTTTVGTPVDKTFTISNIGTSTLNLTQPPPAYMPMMPPGFSLVGTPIPTSLPPGGSMTFIVRMTATAPGNFSGMMSIGTNDSSENPFNFTLSGVVIAPEIAVSLDGANIFDGGPIVNLGTTTLGTALDKTFTVSNVGTANLTLGQINLPAGFSLVSPFQSQSVAPGGSTTFTVRLEAGTAGYSEGELSFANNDGDENPFNFRISGMVTAPEIVVSQSGSDIADGSGPVNFGTTTVGTAVDKTFTITNAGTGNLTLGQISLPAGFSLVSSFGSTTLAPGASTSFTIRLTAAMPGSFTGTLSFGNNVGGENPFDFTLSGEVLPRFIYLPLVTR